MKTTLFLVWMVAMFFLPMAQGEAKAQSVQRNTLATSGGSLSNSSHALNFTLGEAIISEIENGASISQGFWASQGNGETLNISDFVELETEITVFPNPVKDLLNIVSNKTDAFELAVYNLTGQKISSRSYTDGALEHQVDLNHLASGIYLIQIATEMQEVKTLKIIKD